MHTATNIKIGDQVQFRLTELEPLYTGTITKVLRHSIKVDVEHTNIELDISSILGYIPAPKPLTIGDIVIWDEIPVTFLGTIKETGNYLIEYEASYLESGKIDLEPSTKLVVVKPETVKQ